ncbi:MAG: hypothetical protein ABIQ12_14710 [Opitutaceae bacterium]
MNLADVFTVVFVILGFLTLFVGVWLASAGLFPRLVGRCAERLGASPWKCGAVGIGASVPLLALGIKIGNVAPNAALKVLSFAIIASTILAALIGTAGLALRIGQGLRSAEDDAAPWRRVRRGGVVLALTYLTIVLLPVTLVAGFGALLLTLLSHAAAEKDVAGVT